MSINTVALVGFITATVSILVKVIGLPDQIRKNRKRKSTEGLSVSFFLLSFFAYLLWTIYGVLRKDLVLIFGQGIGMVTMGIIAYQIWLYKDNNYEN